MQATASSRASATLGTRRYGLLLALIAFDVGLLLAVPLQGFALVVIAALTAATLMLGVVAAHVSDRSVRVASLAGGLVVLSSVGEAAGGATWLASLTWAALSVLIVVTVLAIARDVMRATSVSVDTLAAAVCVYTLIGLAFAFLYLAIDAAGGMFFAQPGPHDEADFVYFSFIVLSTTGFGDLSPATGIPRAFVVMEAIAGPIFLVTALARLVAIYSNPPGDSAS